LKIETVLVEKDYWIMHCLYGLQQMKMDFELKGGTSLSKGFGIINRFSEDIDIRINPSAEMNVSTGRNQDKPSHVESRRMFYDWLAITIKIDGIVAIERDHDFDDVKLRSGGIRLRYKNVVGTKSDLKDGVLLEVGFDEVTPNHSRTITSWAHDYAARIPDILDNRAIDVRCYDPGFTLVEKLQTISTKFRRQQETGEFPVNFLRHYYDVFCLLAVPEVQAFVGSEQYQVHKAKRFRSENQNIRENEAFVLSKSQTRAAYETAYEGTKSLYYRERPSFSEILARIESFAENL
jgi:hypothetical protein